MLSDFGQSLAPGARFAVQIGCTCDAKSNKFGLGHSKDDSGAPLFKLNNTCPIHGAKIHIGLLKSKFFGEANICTQ